MNHYVYEYRLTDSDRWKKLTFEHKGCTDKDVEGWLKSKFGDRLIEFKYVSHRPLKVETRAETVKSSAEVKDKAIAAMMKRLGRKGE